MLRAAPLAGRVSHAQGLGRLGSMDSMDWAGQKASHPEPAIVTQGRCCLASRTAGHGHRRGFTGLIPKLIARLSHQGTVLASAVESNRSLLTPTLPDSGPNNPSACSRVLRRSLEHHGLEILHYGEIHARLSGSRFRGFSLRSRPGHVSSSNT